MKKKIKDLTIKEIEKLCQFPFCSSSKCKLVINRGETEYCIGSYLKMRRIITEEDLEKEVEIDESNND